MHKYSVIHVLSQKQCIINKETTKKAKKFCVIICKMKKLYYNCIRKDVYFYCNDEMAAVFGCRLKWRIWLEY